jgi:chromate transporter
MLELIGIFLYVGLFTIGGGLVAIPIIQEQVVNRGYISIERFAHMISISEATPGPIGINMATFVGFELYGVLGALIVSVSFILPSYVIITLLYKPLMTYKDKVMVKRIFIYIKASVIGLIFYAGFSLLKISLFDSVISLNTLNITFLLLVITIGIISIYIRKPILYILFGALLGAFMHLIGVSI